MVKYDDDSEPATGWKWIRIPTEYLGDVNGEAVVDWVVVPDRLTFTRRSGGQTILTAEIRLHEDGRVEWSDLHFHGTVQAGVVRALKLEPVAVDEFARAAKHEDFGLVELAGGGVGFTDTTYREVQHGSSDDKAVRKSLRSRGRPPVARERLEDAVRIYLAAEDKPVQAVAAALGLSERTAARRIEKARETGLLPPTTPGKVTR